VRRPHAARWRWRWRWTRQAISGFDAPRFSTPKGKCMSLLADELHSLRPHLTQPVAEDEAGIVTDMLFSRLPAGFDAKFADALNRPDLLSHLSWLRSFPCEYKRAIIQYGASLFSEEVERLTGVVPANPPDDVHSMAREEFCAGDFYFGDMIARALADVGLKIECGGSYLDFGGSPGRVVRTLRAAYPSAHWHGCDPQDRSIEWARENLPQDIEFFLSPLAPPMPDCYQGRLDGVFAISIWSHFSERAALAWFDEMYRLIKPGGWLT
jgi:hypothetical protein